MEDHKKKIEVRDLRNGDWYWSNKLVLDHPYLTNSAKLVYHSLAYFANNKTQRAYPSIATIMELASLRSRTTIIKSIKQLEKFCLIRAEKIKGKVTQYTLLKLTDSRVVHKVNQSIKLADQSTRGTGVVHQRYTNNTKYKTKEQKGPFKKTFKTVGEIMKERSR